MNVTRIFINTYKYDFQFAKVCIASVRYWYPDIPIVLIKDNGAGDFNTKQVEKEWKVDILDTERKTFGWGYGKLEPLFLTDHLSFMILDADTVMAGPVIDKVSAIDAQFIVDEEVQPTERFNEIYYDLNRINEIDSNFRYPGYSFNSGQWFGTSTVLLRKDFATSLEWSNPPKTKFPSIIFNNDQTHLNFVIHRKEQLKEVSVHRIKLMIWPEGNAANFIDLEKIREKKSDYPYIIHWAGMKFKNITDLPRADVISFFQQYYYSKIGKSQKIIDRFSNIHLYYQKKLIPKFKRLLKFAGK